MYEYNAVYTGEKLCCFNAQITVKTTHMKNCINILI